jgi:preprotein translocase subunit SecG
MFSVLFWGMNMTGFSLLAAGFFIKIIAVFFIVCAVVLVLVVLLQKGRGGGLSAAFAGGAASGILGSKTGDFLTWVTIVLVSVFLILAVVLAKFYKPGTTAEFDAGQPMQQTQPIQPSEDRGQPVEEAPFDATGAGESGDVHLPGG